MLALSGANATRFGGLHNKLENESLFGNDNYPKDQAELLHIMNKYKPEVARIVRNQQKNTEELAFIQAGAEKEKLVKAKAGDKATRRVLVPRPTPKVNPHASTVVLMPTGNMNSQN